MRAPLQTRTLHTSIRSKQQAAEAVESDFVPDLPTSSVTHDGLHGIRAQLGKWQQLHGHEDPVPEIPQKIDDTGDDEPSNNLTRLPDSSFSRRSEEQEEQQEEYERLLGGGREGFDGSVGDDGRFLKMGDLVEIENPHSERESVLAVYVQKMQSGDAQFLNMQGRWMHVSDRAVQYSISGWISPKLVEPLLKHLPKPDEPNLDALRDKAYVEDLSVPRELAGPLISRLVQFHNETQDIYRRHSSRLDDAHNLLAHETDLRYGSLTSAATTLLKMPSDKITLAGLYTVRKALTNGGYAFNIDRRSHRLTGYMQIRSKDQVRMIDQVRGWLRAWQDDLAITAGTKPSRLKNHTPQKGAQIVYSFLDKARKIVTENRKNRQPTEAHTVSISKVRLPITEDSDCVRSTSAQVFTDEESEIVRFLESWCCSNSFFGLPRLSSLPPLLVQATGLYKDVENISNWTGYMFLQEMGTIMPYDNRIRFDQHLLLPSSQHSKPLQNLMTSLLQMGKNHDFTDSMAGLRHDWKDLPVYCIDDAGAHEIDDGISVEPAGVGPGGQEQHWLHVHVANPTAFFSRDHPMAKMARHMGESIYMPERTYMMLPRWATKAHFSLQKDRPCLTFSAKISGEAELLDLKVTPGIIRNIVSLTPSEVDEVITGSVKPSQAKTYTVGGQPPPRPERVSKVPSLEERNRRELGILKEIGIKRGQLRERQGGFHFNRPNFDFSVWQSWKRQGLSWDHPYRKGIRRVEGDPVVSLRTTPMENWFASSEDSPASKLVRESMLFACEIAARWCAERQVPIVYRGTVDVPGTNRERFWNQHVQPRRREDGSLPMHVGIEWLQQSRTVLSTEPAPHSLLGQTHYSKATSPLRRYGDMILHWQIEAALREEAKTGKSLVVSPGEKVNRSFLPFSKQVLETIILGLQPRENVITKTKAYAEQFWAAMLVFRKHFQQDGEPFPFGTRESPMKLFIHSPNSIQKSGIFGLSLDLGLSATMQRPEQVGFTEPVMNGDVWEAAFESVDVYRRTILCTPIRLVGREGAGIL